ncbi:MAG: hypothetical protein KOO63_15675 [Bacteroidales bacterium]|nr:hypothetical protein [Candidatus Latescibacterota bacterium]
MSGMQLKKVIQNNRHNIALLIGNGINRHGANGTTNSWDDLLVKMWNGHLLRNDLTVPNGISLTEFYDVLDIHNGTSGKEIQLQKEFCSLMKTWIPQDHHRAIVQWAIKFGAPVLTTNFENTLGDAANCQLFRFQQEGFTDFYPWESYYSQKSLESPDSGFGIWHMNGMQKYYRSIRLGLTHYMGSVERARTWIHKGNEGRLFSGKDMKKWRGANSWLHIIFNKPLAIFGLGLASNEVFLRWLLIERAKYFAKFPERRHPAWFYYDSANPDAGKHLLLESVGVEPIGISDYRELYEDPWN